MSVESASVSAESGLRILVVDDDPIFRSLVLSRLKPLSAKVVEAEDGNAAWRLTSEQAFDLAIVDFDMPNFNGLELIQCLRGHPRTRHIPIVMCTSRNDQSTMNEAIEAGVSSFLTKPINWPLFERHIGHLLHLSAQAASSSAAIEGLQQDGVRKDALVGTLLSELRVHLDLGVGMSRQGIASPDAVAAAVTAATEAIDKFHKAYGPVAGPMAASAHAPAARESAADRLAPRPMQSSGIAAPRRAEGIQQRRLPLPPRL